MIVKGTVITSEVDVQVAKNGGGTYPGARLTYRTEDGKIQEQAFHNNAFKFNAGLKTALTALKAGDVISIDKEKNDAGFWGVKSITKETGGTAHTPATASPKSNYETPEERAKKQVYIVRQSSIANAIALLSSNGGKKNTTEEAIAVAKQFEAYVFGEEFDDGSVMTMKEDII